jgi:hypothetical protein
MQTRSLRIAVAVALGLTLSACSGHRPSSDGKTGHATGGDAGPDGSTGNGIGDGDGDSAGDGDSTSSGGKPTALRIEPAQISIVDNGVSPGETAGVHVFGTFDGKEQDVTSKVTWAIDPMDLLDIASGTLTSKNHGGQGTLSARFGTVEATSSVTVRLEAQFTDANSPPGAANMFPSDTTTDVTSSDMAMGADAPLVIYPSNETMFPRNLERVEYQWRAGASLDVFEIRFESKVASVRYYTADKTWLPTPEVWHWLADTHAGSSLTFSVRGIASASPATIYRSQDVTLFFSGSEVLGALYYWSTGAQGVMRATLSSPAAAKFFTDPASGDKTCVSCHTVARNGKRLAGGYGGESLRQVSIPERTLQIPSAPATKGMDYGFGTYNPAASRLLFSNKGLLTLLNAETGQKIKDLTLPAGAFASHPDWSPDGKYVAVSYQVGGKAPGNKAVQGTSLARIPVLANDAFGDPEVLVASTGANDTLYFPSHSPDSKYIAFVRGVGQSKDNSTSQLWLVPAAGGDPIALTRLNERVGNEDKITGIGNSMPTWAPSSQPGLFWLAISSIRNYGDILVGTTRDQLWGAAVDPALIAKSKDPSFPAFWMPFQNLEEGNHRAFWAIDTEAVCPSTIEICDDLDNDCDGIVDENCCTPSAEICGNDKDEDCDGAADDGCGCMSAEICGNGMDDDCDGQTDSADDDCACNRPEDCNNGLDDDCDGKTDSADDDCPPVIL